MLQLEIKARVMATEQLKEMLSSQIRDLKTELGQGLRGEVEETTKKLATHSISFEQLKRQLEDSIVDAKLNEELLRAEMEEALRAFVSETFSSNKLLIEEEVTVKVEAVYNDMERFKAKVKSDRADINSLQELMIGHTDEFADLQKKIEAHEKKHKAVSPPSNIDASSLRS